MAHGVRPHIVAPGLRFVVRLAVIAELDAATEHIATVSLGSTGAATEHTAEAGAATEHTATASLASVSATSLL